MADATTAAGATTVGRPLQTAPGRARGPMAVAGVFAVALIAATLWLLGSREGVLPAEERPPASGTVNGGTAPAPVSDVVAPVRGGGKPTKAQGGPAPSTAQSPVPATDTTTAPPVTTDTTTQPTTTTAANAPDPTTEETAPSQPTSTEATVTAPAASTVAE